MVCLTSLEPLVLKNAPQQRCTRTAEEERNYTPQKTQQCDVNTITQCHRFSPSSSQSLVTQELECISKMQIHGIIKILIHAIIFIHFRPRFWKVTFVFLLTLKDLRFSFSRWTFLAVSCKAISGEELWGCQLFSQCWQQQQVSVHCSWVRRNTSEMEHHWADWETQKFNTSVFCTQLPAYTWANPGISSWGLYTHFPL